MYSSHTNRFVFTVYQRLNTRGKIKSKECSNHLLVINSLVKNYTNYGFRLWTIYDKEKYTVCGVLVI